MKLAILETVLEAMPKKWVTYLGAALMALTGLIQAEASLPVEDSLFDVPQAVTNAMAMASTAILAVGLRRGQQKAENAAIEAVNAAAAMPAKETKPIVRQLSGIVTPEKPKGTHSASID